MATGTVVVTNDDGIDSPGLRRLVEALEPVADAVTVVAPAGNQSAVGRSIEATAAVERHELGYAIHGSPATCVVAAVSGLALDPDVVVSGINKGANLGAPMLGRSGTVGAAIEAAYLGLPSIAVSAYVPFERIQGDFHDFDPGPAEFDPAATIASHLTEAILGGERVDGVDYLNVNAPLAGELREPRAVVTEPAPGYYTTGAIEDGEVHLRDRQFELLHTGDLDVEDGTDRGALADGLVSVSPICLPNEAPAEAVRTATADQLLAGSADALAGRRP